MHIGNKSIDLTQYNNNTNNIENNLLNIFRQINDNLTHGMAEVFNNSQDLFLYSEIEVCFIYSLLVLLEMCPLNLVIMV